jgi:hypothetical protein
VQSQGVGACCLYYSTASLQSYKCRPSTFVSYYTSGPNYNANDKIWTDPDRPSNKIRVNCKIERDEIYNKFAYPYLQPWLTGTEVVSFDPVNTNVRSDQFYKPL